MRADRIRSYRHLGLIGPAALIIGVVMVLPLGLMAYISVLNPDNAKTFINWMMAPENIAMASNFAGYMNAIEGSEKYLDESLAQDPAVNMPAEYADRLRPEANCSAAARELRNRVWTRLKS